MMKPTLAQLTDMNERAAVALSRLKSLPFDEQWEITKQSANKKIDMQMSATDPMLQAPIQVN